MRGVWWCEGCVVAAMMQVSVVIEAKCPVLSLCIYNRLIIELSL